MDWRTFIIPAILTAVGGIFGALICRKWPWMVAWFSATGQDTINARLRGEIEDGERRYNALRRKFLELQSELSAATDERNKLQARVKEIEGLFLGVAETNQRQQGEINRLQHQAAEALDIKDELRQFITKEIRDVRTHD